tara:strand:- start:479 stop:853 length:375 start_codon:yes stop_codon:yes gene_type:complete
MKIKYINFGVRIQNHFKSLGLETTDEIINYPLRELINIKGFGMKSFTAVKRILEELKLVGKMRYNVWSFIEETDFDFDSEYPFETGRGDLKCSVELCEKFETFDEAEEYQRTISLEFQKLLMEE